MRTCKEWRAYSGGIHKFLREFKELRYVYYNQKGYYGLSMDENILALSFCIAMVEYEIKHSKNKSK